MAKVFRLHNNGKNSLVDWAESSLQTNNIDQIVDPEGETARKNITSIPSPFARIDLVKTAFAQVVRSQKTDDNTIYHKMVSDTLDVGEIFFNSDLYRNQGIVDILHWDRKRDLPLLIQNQPAVGEVLQMYLTQDAPYYNFDLMEGIFMLRYQGPGMKSNLEIIGGTSPSTLFFSTANNLSHVAKQINFGGADRPFDGSYSPLEKRDPDFIKWLFSMQNDCVGFSVKFKEVSDYLALVYRQLSHQMQQECNAAHTTDFGIVAMDSGSVVQILSGSAGSSPVFAGKKSSATNWTSDFEIATNKTAAGLKPLVLPVSNGNRYSSLTFTTAHWNGSNRAPYYDSTPVANRQLPIVGVSYPYLTIGDFLEDTLVQMPYKMNSSRYFDGQLTSSHGEIETSYLLPIKPTYFDYFDVADLRQALSMRIISGGGVDVTLRIPIKGNAGVKYIEYTRTYHSGSQDPDIENNKGCVREYRLGLAMMPLVQSPAQDKAYRIALFDKCNDDTATLQCYMGNKQQRHISHKRMGKGGDAGACAIEAFACDNGIDHLRVVYSSGAQGIVVPTIAPAAGGKVFTFAVDLGTTNTHIEYTDSNGQEPAPFAFSHKDIQMVALHESYGNDHDIAAAILDYFSPSSVGGDSEFCYPMRTAYAVSNNTNFNTKTTTLVNGNIAFGYEKRDNPRESQVCTNLKWTTEDNGLDKLRLYIEQICVMLRNKVLLNNGNLSATRLLWFYPISMSNALRNKLEAMWKNAWKQYFGSDSEVYNLSESAAPYYYMQSHKGTAGNVVTIDVGGGTSDVFVVSDKKPQMISSFRFAAESLFGDGYGHNPDDNGFVSKYYDFFENVIADNDSDELDAETLVNVMRTIRNSGRSADICSFFFSLQREDIDALDFSKRLMEEKSLRHVFVLFYSAIIYFVAKEMRLQGLHIPEKVCFSGNGSRTLAVVSTNDKTLANWFKSIFEEVYQEGYPLQKSFTVIRDEHPKELTCKGGFSWLATQEDLENVPKKSWLGGDEGQFCGVADTAYAYSQIDKAKVISNVKEFVDMVYRLGTKNNFFSNDLDLNMAIVSQIQDWCQMDLETYLDNGIELRRQEQRNLQQLDDTAEETLFFYPIVGMLNELARRLV